MTTEEYKKLQDDMWKEFDDLNLEDNYLPHDGWLDDMIEEYQEALILKLAEVEIDVPDWIVLDEEDENE